MAQPRSYLLLHGFANHRPPEHWMHWLTGQLAALGERVIYPQLPDPDRPTLGGWRAALATHLAELSDRRGGERIVLAHSLSCLLWMHAAATIPAPQRPDRVVLVSPPAVPCIPAPARGFALTRLDGAALRASARREIRIVGSDADPYNPEGVDRVYAAPLGVACDLLVGGGHISSDDGYGPWPAMLDWCRGPGGPVLGAARPVTP